MECCTIGVGEPRAREIASSTQAVERQAQLHTHRTSGQMQLAQGRQLWAQGRP